MNNLIMGILRHPKNFALKKKLNMKCPFASERRMHSNDCENRVKLNIISLHSSRAKTLLYYNIQMLLLDLADEKPP